MTEQFAETSAASWRAENADAIASSNAYVERRGLPLRRPTK
ncbi:type II toxin-antitoxin system CcdA family antitoxin [Sphingobium sp. AN558]